MENQGYSEVNSNDNHRDLIYIYVISPCDNLKIRTKNSKFLAFFLYFLPPKIYNGLIFALVAHLQKGDLFKYLVSFMSNIHFEDYVIAKI